MIPRRIQGTTHYLGAPKGWTPEISGHCGHLAVRQDGPAFESVWEPTPDEIEAIIQGGSVILRVFGGQPPVALYVEAPALSPEPQKDKGG